MILDTNAVSAFLAGQTEIRTALSGNLIFHLPVLVIGEYRYGLLRSTRRSEIEPQLATLIEESIVLAVDLETTQQYAFIKNALREKGRPIPVNDLWIAALALQHRLPVVSRDGHFDEVPDLERLSW